MSLGLGETPTLAQISEYASKIIAPTRDSRDDPPIFKGVVRGERRVIRGPRARSSCRQVEVKSRARSSSRTSARFSASHVRRPPRARCAGGPLSSQPAGARHATRHALGSRARDLQALDSSGVPDTIWPFCLASQRRLLGSSCGERLGSKRRANSCSLSSATPSTFGNNGPVQALRRSFLAAVTICAYVAAQSYHGRPH